MLDDFYKKFEDKFRGDRTLILERLKVYIPFLECIKKENMSLKLLDLGCGRGEWLELTKSLGFEAHGVDLDEAMLQNAKAFELSVEIADAISYLISLPSNSISVISGFHIVEHLPFESLQVLVKESLRVLENGGLLILETPNPENIIVATSNFYLDPTHLRPIPPKLLEFLPQHYGFMRTKILRLQEDKSLADNKFVNVLQLLGGVSPDYAIIAQKSSEMNFLETFDKLFDKEYGLSMDMLALKFETRLMHFETILKDFEKNFDSVFLKVEETRQTAIRAKEEANTANTKAEHAWAEYYAVLNSRSWKITKPLRKMTQFSKWFLRGSKAWLTFSPESRPRRVCKKVLMHFMHYVSTKPFLKYSALRVLNRLPKLKLKLKKFLPEMSTISSENTPITLNHLSPRAREIYFDLKALLIPRNVDGSK